MQLSSLPGLYIHIPFCSEVCPYCDFAVLKAGVSRRRRFASLLAAEMELQEGAWEPFDTLYLGGGTPSILPVEDLEAILQAARQRLGLRADAWIFLEANPEDVTPEACAAWRGLGVATLSLGVQSFSAEALRFLGRRHAAPEARAAVEIAREAGFATLSLDLIYGLPGQGPAAWRRELETAIGLAPDHLSCYQLTVHEGTPFALRRRRGQLSELAEPEQAQLFELTHELLAAAGFPAYEVSNFARGPEHRSRHNQKYWHHTPYLGLGPSAHSFDATARFWNEARLHRYQARLLAGERPVAGRELIHAEQRALEAVMLGLRTTDGIDLAVFRERHGFDLAAANAGRLERWEQEGWLRPRSGRLALTVAGLALADGLAAALDLGESVPTEGVD